MINNEKLSMIVEAYSLYSGNPEKYSLITDLSELIREPDKKLKQVASEIQQPKLKQAASELTFPPVFAYVPWMHHVSILQRCKTI